MEYLVLIVHGLKKRILEDILVIEFVLRVGPIINTRMQDYKLTFSFAVQENWFSQAEVPATWKSVAHRARTPCLSVNTILRESTFVELRTRKECLALPSTIAFLSLVYLQGAFQQATLFEWHYCDWTRALFKWCRIEQCGRSPLRSPEHELNIRIGGT